MGFVKKVIDNPKWYTDLLTKQRRQNCADHQYLTRNGVGEKIFDTVLKMVGNGYKGKR